MGTCLVTTLNESVTDTSLLKLGQLRLIRKPSGNNVIKVNTPASFYSVTVKSPGYITDSTGTQNLGQTGNTTGGVMYFPALSEEYDIIFNDKYSITSLLFTNASTGIYANVYWDLKDLTGMPIQSIKTALADGSLSDLPTNMRGVYLANLTHGKGITGNVSHFIDCTTLIQMDIRDNTRVVGSLASFAGCTSLTYLDVSGTSITGDTSDLAGLTNLTTFAYANTDITGNWPLT
jgi:hypothetical protein